MNKKEYRCTLKLNGGLPHQSCHWKDAIYCIFDSKNSAYVLEEYDDFPLHRGNGDVYMYCPSVINLINYVHPRKLKYSRKHIHLRDDYRCQYCGRPLSMPQDREIDHIIPKSDPICPNKKQNVNDEDLFKNMVTVCSYCNRQKANKHLYAMSQEKCWNNKPFQLIKKPEAPIRVGYIRFVQMVREYNLLWLKYIPDWIYYAECCNKLWLIDLYREKFGEDEFLLNSITDAEKKGVVFDY